MGSGRHRGKKKGRAKQDRDSNPRQSTEEIVENGNFRFECYYALQGIHNQHFNSDGALVDCETDEERDAERLRWINAMKSSLPASFRIGKDVPAFYQDQLAQELANFITAAVNYQPTATDKKDVVAVPAAADLTLQQRQGRTCSAADFAALVETSVQKLSFLPFAYQLSLDRVALRRNPALKELQNWLKAHAADGHITRQETVSMIPPVLLNVSGDDRVLDMCAAPGSKTSQMLEDMSATKQGTGYLIANDSNTHRAYLLSHQLRRILYHHPVALITTSNAQNFPGVISFDKILCDVPCSGDGTSRKNIDVWLKWANGGALGLHYLQLQIAKRGAELLTVGGTMCYSTCSQNPVENEAVVAELLRTGCLELVECHVEGFKTRPGRSHWKVLYEPRFEQQKSSEGDQTGETSSSKPGNGDETTEAVPKDRRHAIFKPNSWNEDNLVVQAKTVNLHVLESYADVPELYRRKIRKTVFPPTQKEAATMHLERCLRCLPQDNNTGGFFSAMLKKIAPMNRTDRRSEEERVAKRQKVEEDVASATPAATADEPEEPKPPEEDEEVEAIDEEDILAPNEGRASAREKEKLDKDNFVEAPGDIMDSIIEFYGLSNGFEKRLFHYRSLGEKNTLYYVSPQVKAVFEMGMQDRITVVNTGLKAFSRNTKRADHVHGDYRVCQESIHFIVNHMTKRKLSMPLSDFKLCLDGIGDKAMAMDTLSEQTREKLNGLEPGSFVATVEGYDDRPGMKLIACMWRNKAPTVNCLIGKIELTGMRKKLEAMESQSSSAIGC